MRCDVKKNIQCKIILILLIILLGEWFFGKYYIWHKNKSMFKFVDTVNKKYYFHLKNYTYKNDYDEFRDTLKEKGLYQGKVYRKLIKSKNKKVVGFLFSNGKGQEGYYDKKGNRIGYRTQILLCSL